MRARLATRLVPALPLVSPHSQRVDAQQLAHRGDGAFQLPCRRAGLSQKRLRLAELRALDECFSLSAHTRRSASRAWAAHRMALASVPAQQTTSPVLACPRANMSATLACHGERPGKGGELGGKAGDGRRKRHGRHGAIVRCGRAIAQCIEGT